MLAYVAGVRLDSIDAQYAKVYIGYRSHFNFGQQADGVKEMILTDSNGKFLTFSGSVDIGVLNLLYYNGWELVEPNYSTPTWRYYLLKKRSSK
ncbi:MAG: hypothetical protein JWQ96_2486 [Segetibacter sp.]|jgi:hypothetical protein|nr:hypothetical protein [Segetibacter sp.]